MAHGHDSTTISYRTYFITWVWLLVLTAARSGSGLCPNQRIAESLPSGVYDACKDSGHRRNLHAPAVRTPQPHPADICAVDSGDHHVRFHIS